MARALVSVPARAKRGEVVEIKALISHPMETGYRTGPDGKLVPRDIIHRFLCTFEGEEVFSADLAPAISANPFLSFTLRAERSGVLTFRWLDDKGGGQVETASLVVDG
ncbi:thiosulfate oxidation carrier complex protein SoxZ [Alsobacter sp. KACC 23698]|uniref:Thiosulfate oxidation carrier complex protein SoxZ n=1 Tax=Alsobacter sp. KACC 23698 TaxID=3149229 RepID=A0AAU7JKR0_9HYPH